jgi:hypothetical protein
VDDPFEHYLLVAWPADQGGQVLWKLTDRYDREQRETTAGKPVIDSPAWFEEVTEPQILDEDDDDGSRTNRGREGAHAQPGDRRVPWRPVGPRCRAPSGFSCNA